MTPLFYALIAPDDPALAALIARHAAHSAAHYPSDSNHNEDGAALAAQGAVMFAGRGGPAGPVLAMGGYKPIGPDAAEIKSMHVAEAARGQGAGAHILGLILAHAHAAGLRRISLETGSLPASAAARRLYARAGFVTCPAFGTYRPDPMSIFMTRTL
ncbi:GNAT family N-acetyltransferase [Roseicyclus sp.]|uniref:GNAT family N-acetyltransferase n=1 Tax=Roseicyclus sp. TaxID=1914329 RepID=UPI003F6C31F6